MSLIINHNLMAMDAARNLSNSIAQGSMRVQTARDDAAGLAVREIQRAEIKSLNSQDAQPATEASDPAAAAPESAASQAAAQPAQAASAPEQQTGAIVNTSDHLAGSVRAALSSLQGGSLLQGGNFHPPNLSTPDVGFKLQGMGLFKDPLPPEFDGPGSAVDARMGTIMRHGQDMINATAHNAEMVNNLIKGTG